MAKLTDLPPELIHRIIEQVINAENNLFAHALEHARLGLPPPEEFAPTNQPDAETLMTTIFQSAFGGMLSSNPPQPDNRPTTPPLPSPASQQPTSSNDPIPIQTDSAILSSGSDRPGQSSIPDTVDFSSMPPLVPDDPIPNSAQNSPSADLHRPTTTNGHSTSTPIPSPSPGNSRASQPQSKAPPNPIDELQVSWPDGLPSDPLLPFALINRTFQQCAQETLFKHVALYTQWQASLFVRTLSRSKSTYGDDKDEAPLLDIKGKRKAACEDETVSSPRTYRRLDRLEDYVRSLRFMWNGPSSMGKGGGSLICDTIQLCPRLENIGLGTALLSHCKEPLYKALESRSTIREFVVFKNTSDHSKKLEWQYDEIITRLFTQWDALNTFDVFGLTGSPAAEISATVKALPVFRCTLTVVVLKRPDLAESELAALLAGSLKTLDTLSISLPTAKLDRRGLYRVLKESTGPRLESFTLVIGEDWHPLTPKRTKIREADPMHNPFIIDLVFKNGALARLKNLNICGPVASSELFPALPETIVKLGWNDCGAIEPGAFAKFLSTWRRKKRPSSSYQPVESAGFEERVRGLPELKCCSVGTDDLNWKPSDRRAVRAALKDRNACFHSSNEHQPVFGPPGWLRPGTDDDDDDDDDDEDSDDSPYIPNYDEDDDDEDHSDSDDSESGEDVDYDDGDSWEDEDFGRYDGEEPESEDPGPPMYPGMFGMPMAAYPMPGGGMGAHGSSGNGSWFISSFLGPGPGPGPTAQHRGRNQPAGSRPAPPRNTGTGDPTAGPGLTAQHRGRNQPAGSRPTPPTNTGTGNATARNGPPRLGLPNRFGVCHSQNGHERNGASRATSSGANANSPGHARASGSGPTRASGSGPTGASRSGPSRGAGFGRGSGGTRTHNNHQESSGSRSSARLFGPGFNFGNLFEKK